jgi:fructokinase
MEGNGTDPRARMLGGIELGGTKTVVAVSPAGAAPQQEERFPTTSPAETLARAAEFFRRTAGGRPAGLGVASFGPLSIDRGRADYGRMLLTPKAGWAGFPLAGELRRLLPGCPIELDTDVNGAALAEGELGAARGCRDFAYITVGTGIGAGMVSGGRLVHGVMHPEFGHLRVPRHPRDDFAGACPFHGDCLEGLASGPALARRWGREGRDLPPDHPAWEIEAWYLAQGCLALLAILSLRRVVLGGGVPQAPGLVEGVNRCLTGLAGGYFEQVREPAQPCVVPAALGQQAGITGALLLAAHAARGVIDGGAG